MTTQAAQLTDFSDRLSPMVVKELRQGLRNRRFVLTMLGLHLLLSLLTLAMGGDSSEGVGEFMSFLVMVVILVILPLSGSGAVAAEINAGTLEMLMLSRLSAWRIITGKWAAIVLQTLLLTVSLLPYQVAAYFQGGMELWQAVAALIVLWLASALLTAATIALSSLRQAWVRMIFLGIPLMMMGTASLRLLFSFIFGGPSASMAALPPAEVIPALILWAWMVFTCLSTAALRIAPAASMLPTAMRLVNGLTMALMGLGAWLFGLSDAFLVWLMVILTTAFLGAFCEPDRTLPSHYTPFYRLPMPLRWSAWLLAPGWCHGWLFTLFLTSLTMGLAWWRSLDSKGWEQVWMVACSLWLMGLMARLMDFRGRANRFILLIFSGILLVVMSSLLAAAPYITRDAENWKGVLVLLPTTAWRTPEPWHKAGLVLAALWPALLLPAFFKTLRLNRTAREEARRSLTA